MRILAALILWIAAGDAAIYSQSAQIAISGEVTDPSGSRVPRVSLQLIHGDRLVQSTLSDAQGHYEFRNLTPGVYTLRASAKGFAAFRADLPELAVGTTRTFPVQLVLASQSDRVTVADISKVDLSPESNAGALVLRGKDLEALSDDRDEFAADLQALAGPSAGPNGGQIFIDGFTGGRMPPKSSIREVRINQNPFSAQFDKLGYGRIEVFTKPGTEDYHGELVFIYGNDVFNSRNPFIPEKPPYERRQWEGEVGGPLGKKTSFLTDFELRRTTENAFINALTLDMGLNVVPVTQGVVTPLRGTEFNFRLDRQLTANQTLTARYGYQKDERENQGVGGFSLASRAYQNSDREDSVQVSETGIYGAHVVNETRARYLRLRSRQEGVAGQPTISVLDAFTGGGTPLTLSFNNQDRYEFNNLTTYVRGAHLFRWGGRLRGVSLRDQDTQNYIGAYTFSSLQSYRLTLLGLQQNLSADQIRKSGGGASQFSIAGGNPLADISQFDAGLFAQDDWRVRPNLMLSLGLRYEVQTNLGDHKNFAPRASIAWGLGANGKVPKTVVRAGGGMFYDRVSESLSLDALRRDGVHQQQFLIQSPDFFPAVPSTDQLASARMAQTIRKVDSGMDTPRIVQGALGIERALPKKIVLTTNYVHTQSIHQLRSQNINVQLGGVNAIYLYEASGRFRQNQWITSVTAKLSDEFSLSSSYTLGKARSDTDGAGTFPSDPNSLRSEFGRAGFDTRHRVQVSGSIGLPWDLRISPLLVATSGLPFNITVGRDLNGDTLFTDRPALAADLTRPSVVRTAWGAFDLAPQSGSTIIPRNLGSGPAQFALNMRMSKTIKIGKSGKTAAGKDREPKELIFHASTRNILNHPNFALPIGNLSSLLFGQSTSLAAGRGGGAAGNRRLDLQVKFTF